MRLLELKAVRNEITTYLDSLIMNNFMLPICLHNVSCELSPSFGHFAKASPNPNKYQPFSRVTPPNYTAFSLSDDVVIQFGYKF